VPIAHRPSKCRGRSGSAGANLNPTVFTIDPNLRMPHVQQWTLGIEREIFRDTVLEVRYVGNHRVKLLRGSTLIR
jgi:hypothetical protein